MSWLLSPAGAVADIGLIGDVTITGVTAGELLQWNGSAWINRTKAEAGVLANVVEDASPQLGGNLDPDGNSWEGDLFVTGNNQFRVESSVPSIYTEFDRQTSELRVTPSGAGNGLWLRTGTDFRIYDNSNVDYLSAAHDGTDFTFAFNGTSEVNFAFNAGIPIQFGPTNTAGLRFGTSNLFVRQEVALADDATATFDVGNYTYIVVVSTFNSTANSCAFWTTTQAPLDIGSGSAVSLGTGSNPDVDGNVNLWKSDSNTFNIRNRLGSTRNFAVLIFSALAI